MATCDAGNGCSITCTNGCGAVYSNGTCTKWCEPSFNAEDIPEGIFEEKFSIEVNDLAIGILDLLHNRLFLCEEVPGGIIL